jgi:hypothetical protein
MHSTSTRCCCCFISRIWICSTMLLIMWWCGWYTMMRIEKTTWWWWTIDIKTKINKRKKKHMDFSFFLRNCFIKKSLIDFPPTSLNWILGIFLF